MTKMVLAVLFVSMSFVATLSHAKDEKKKPEGARCTYTSECESRPGMRCARPRGAPLKTPTTCMLKGY